MRRYTLAPLGRRWWIIVLCVLVASVSAYGAERLRSRSYTADALLVVPSAGPGPGKADEATRLATTYAALIPQDQQLLRYVGARFGLTAKQVRRHVTATTDTTTALVVVHYRAGQPDLALRAATIFAYAVTGAQPVTRNVRPHSLSIVHLPSHVTASKGAGTIVPLGAILGLFVGIILLVALERADPRIDHEDDLSAHAGCPVTSVSELSHEAAAAIVHRWRMLTHAQRPTIALVPTSSRAERALPALLNFLAGAGRADRIHFVVCPARGTNGGLASLAAADGSVVVAPRGGAVSDLTTTLEAIRTFGAPELWALFLDSERPRPAAEGDGETAAPAERLAATDGADRDRPVVDFQRERLPRSDQRHDREQAGPAGAVPVDRAGEAGGDAGEGTVAPPR
jgi:capsular polysaccharide biosynthesis protein